MMVRNGDWVCENHFAKASILTCTGTMEVKIRDFPGAVKINTLVCYPLKYHDNALKLRTELIERGRKFVSLQGMQYKTHLGMAWMKVKGIPIKVSVTGRIMIDPATHRRINPNYPV